jgi:hypothetical protein
MPLLAVEGAVDDVTGIGQRGRKLAVKIGVVLDDEQAQGGVSGSASADNFAIGGVNGFAEHSATAPEQSQHIDKPVVVAAEPGAHQLGMMAVFAPIADRLGERYGLLLGYRRVLLSLI